MNKGDIMNAVRDKEEIRNNIESWVVYRDAFLWDKFRKVWHPDGVMIATWAQCTYEQFIKNTEEAKGCGFSVLHILGGSGIEVNGDRAISMTKMMISQRIDVGGILCDVSCYARHFDFWIKYENAGKRIWGLRRRETICDKDHMFPVNPNDAGKVNIDEALLAQYPVEYRYLAYCNLACGYPCSPDNVPVSSGNDALYNLYDRGEKWLAGTIEQPEG